MELIFDSLIFDILLMWLLLLVFPVFLFEMFELFTEWNPTTIPKYAMVDFDSAEIISLERVFPSIKIFLCDFHREQAWTRYCTYVDILEKVVIPCMFFSINIFILGTGRYSF